MASVVVGRKGNLLVRRPGSKTIVILNLRAEDKELAERFLSDILWKLEFVGESPSVVFARLKPGRITRVLDRDVTRFFAVTRYYDLVFDGRRLRLVPAGVDVSPLDSAYQVAGETEDTVRRARLVMELAREVAPYLDNPGQLADAVRVLAYARGLGDPLAGAPKARLVCRREAVEEARMLGLDPGEVCREKEQILVDYGAVYYEEDLEEELREKGLTNAYILAMLAYGYPLPRELLPEDCCSRPWEAVNPVEGADTLRGWRKEELDFEAWGLTPYAKWIVDFGDRGRLAWTIHAGKKIAEILEMPEWLREQARDPRVAAGLAKAMAEIEEIPEGPIHEEYLAEEPTRLYKAIVDLYTALRDRHGEVLLNEDLVRDIEVLREAGIDVKVKTEVVKIKSDTWPFDYEVTYMHYLTPEELEKLKKKLEELLHGYAHVPYAASR